MVEERWLPVAEPGFEDLYEVSDCGHVKSLPRATVKGIMGGQVLTPGLHPKGYHFVVLSGRGKRKSLTIQRLVLGAFVGPRPDGLEARHLNGDPTDNRWPENLIWGTSSDNENDKRRHGTMQEGERNGMTKLTAEQVQEIIRRYDNGNGESQRTLAAAYGIRQPQVSRLVNGKRWAHLTEPDK